MKLYELDPNSNISDFDERDPLRVATVATLSDINSKIDDTEFNSEYKISSLLKRLRDNGINMTREQLSKVIDQEPWKNFISDIKDDDVAFNRSAEDDIIEPDADEKQNTMIQMANRAAKK